MNEMRETKEEIKIGSRVKIKENANSYPLSLKGRVGIVVDDAGNGRVTILFPGWEEGHDGNSFSRIFGNLHDTCWELPLFFLELVHDGFEIGDTVEYETADGCKTGTVVDFSMFDGNPLVEFSDLVSFATHDGNDRCVTNERHSENCYYCDPEWLSPKASKPAASFSVSTRSDGTVIVTIPRGQKVEIVSL